LAALHNFIRIHDPQAKTHLTGNDSDHAPGGFYAGDDSLIPPGTGVDIEVEEEQISEATRRRNKIADDMWRQYQEVLHQRSLATNEESDEESDEESNEGSDDDFYL
jgi:hypothetical protein